jgi:urease accessory protein
VIPIPVAAAMVKFSGHLQLRAAPSPGGRTTLAAQSFRAPYHLSKPYWDADAGALLVQVVNPTAGILEGDALTSDIAVDAAGALLVTTPSASRVFKMRAGSAQCRQRFTVARDAWLEVLPEPLVPHRGSRYHQQTTVDVARGGGLFCADLLMPGRVAHGEAWGWTALCLETEVRLDGELILRERFDHSGEELRALAKFAGSGEEACFGNVVLVAAGDAPWLEAVRALHGEGVWLGASALRRGGWSIKFVAPDSIRLRATLKRLRAILAAHYPRLGCDPRKL